jgi:predicted ATPase
MLSPLQLGGYSLKTEHMERFVVISGCSGGGKSTLLAELERRGYAVIEEPGRRIVKEEQLGSGSALPWVDLSAFAQRAIELALRDFEQAKTLPGLVFFDRGLIDAAAALEFATGRQALATVADIRYNPFVFIAPPWPEIYVGDDERRHSLQEAVQEYERLLRAFSTLGYGIKLLPKVDVSKRADFVIQRLRMV